jgi:hypothetical protein
VRSGSEKRCYGVARVGRSTALGCKCFEALCYTSADITRKGGVAALRERGKSLKVGAGPSKVEKSAAPSVHKQVPGRGAHCVRGERDAPSRPVSRKFLYNRQVGRGWGSRGRGGCGRAIAHARARASFRFWHKSGGPSPCIGVCVKWKVQRTVASLQMGRGARAGCARYALRRPGGCAPPVLRRRWGEGKGGYSTEG